MKLTKEEKQIILNHRKNEEQKEIKLMGISKEDLYILDSSFLDFSYYILPKEQINAEMINFVAKSILLPAGTKFVGRINLDGTEWWFDKEGLGAEWLQKEWAEKNLINIQKYSNKRKK